MKLALAKPRGYVLAGGRSIRMGQNKARLPCRGVSCAAWLCETLEAAGLEPWLVLRVADGLPWVDRRGQPIRRLFEPPWDGAHPLWGFAAALEHSADQPFVVVPCDVPGLAVGSIRRMVEAAPVIAVDGDGRRHPLVGAFSPGVFHATDLRGRALAGGRVLDVFSSLAVMELPSDELVNWNSPADTPTSPIEALERAAPDGVDRRRLAEGERARMASRGVVDGVSFDREEGR
jgi:molybdopterin-guanine dinucleotide biosynthesis protein A